MAGGRPSKYNDGLIEQVRELALDGKTDDEIAAALDVSRSTLALWKARHPQFSDALKAWKGEADDAVEQSLYRKALSGDVTACIFWLKNRRSVDWRDKREVEHSGGVKHTYDLDSIEPESLEHLERILADAERSAGGAGEAVPSQVH
jgi:hypothetical protein